MTPLRLRTSGSAAFLGCRAFGFNAPVRAATRDRDSSLNRQITGADDKYSYLEAVPEETEPSYVSFTGTPGHAEGFNAANIWVDLMEATVAEIAFDAAFPSPSPSPMNIA